MFPPSGNHEVDVVATFFDKSPRVQIIAGAAMFLGGAACSVILWNGGIVWGLAIASVAAGPLLLLNGYDAVRRLRALRAQIDLVNRQAEELLEEIASTKSSGGDVVKMLTDRGITELRVRQALLREARKRTEGRGHVQPPVSHRS